MTAPPRPAIAFDALFLDPGVSGGPETVLRGLVPAVATLRPELDITVVTSRRGASALREDGWTEFTRIVSLPSDDDRRVRKVVTQQLMLARLARRRGWRLVHSLSNLGPIRISPPLVLTVYDVVFLRQPTMRGLSRMAIGAFVRQAAPRAAAVVTMSEASKADIIEDLRVDPARVFVVRTPGRPPGPAADPSALRARLGLQGRRIVLNVAAKRRHKNQALLIRAVERLPSDVTLVMVGHDGGEGAALRRLAAASAVGDRIVQLDYVPDDELEALYSMAACVALPTRAEGYGLPVLEAMQRGIPVACSDLPVLREVGADAVVYFDPSDPAAAAEVINRVLAGGGFASRGRLQAARFSWESAARQHFDIYERCTSA